MTPIDEVQVPSPADEPSAQAEKKSPRRHATAKKEAPLELVLLPLWEVDAVRVLCGGAVYLAPRDSRASDRDSVDEVTVWRGCVPADALLSVVRGREFGSAVLLELEVPRGSRPDKKPTRRVRLPISVSRLRRVLFRTIEERDVFVARHRGFPDVPLDVASFEAESAAFGPSTYAELALGKVQAASEDAVAAGTPSVRAIDKVLGVVACALHALRTEEWDPSVLERVVLACNAPPEAPAAMVRSLAEAMEGEGPDAVGTMFATALAYRLALLGPKEGFEPEALLGELVSELAVGIDGERAAVLRRFEKAAVGILDGTSSAGKTMTDDDGSIGLRASLALLRVVGDPIQLEAAARKAPAMGRKVRVLAWALVGCQRGCAGLTNAVKNAPAGMLAALGDLAEAVEQNRAGWLSGAAVSSVAGRIGWQFELCGRAIADIKVAGQERLEPVLTLAERRGWRCSAVAASDLTYGISVAGYELAEVRFSVNREPPVFPRRSRIVAAVDAARKVAKALPQPKVLEEFIGAAERAGVALRLCRVDRGWMPRFEVFLDDGRSDDAVDKAIESLTSARGAREGPTVSSESASNSPTTDQVEG